MTTRRVPRRHRWAAMAALAAALVGCLALTTAGPAHAEDSGDAGGAGGAGGSAVRTETVQTASTRTTSSVATAVAKCPAGYQLIGVGYAVVDGKPVAVDRILPDLATDSVKVTGRYVGSLPVTKWGVQATAVCGWGLPEPYLARSTTSSVVDRRLTGVALCDEGDTALSTGFSLSGTTGQMLLTDLLPDGGQASVTVEEQTAGIGAGVELTTIAICADMSGYKVVQVAAQPLPILVGGKAGPAIEVAVCPAGYLVSGGGASLTTDTVDVGRQLLTMALPLVGTTGSFVAAHRPLISGLTPDPAKLTAYAICFSIEA